MAKGLVPFTEIVLFERSRLKSPNSLVSERSKTELVHGELDGMPLLHPIIALQCLHFRPYKFSLVKQGQYRNLRQKGTAVLRARSASVT